MVSSNRQDKMTKNVKIAFNPFTESLETAPAVILSGESRLISVSPDAELDRCLKLLHENHISSAPVVTERGQALGFIDMLDIIEYIIICLKATKSSVDVHRLYETLITTNARTVMNYSRRDTYCFISGGDSLRDCLKSLMSGSIRRIAVGRVSGDMAGIPLGICSPSDLITYLSQEINSDAPEEQDKKTSMKSMADIPIEKLIHLLKVHHFFKLSSDVSLLEACSALIENSCDSITILSGERLHCALTPSDFDSWNEKDLQSFSEPVMDYLMKKQLGNRQPVSLPAGVCTLGKVIHTMASLHCKAVWICDQNYHPVDVITELDLMRIIASLEIHS